MTGEAIYNLVDSMTAIETTGLTKQFGSVTALDGLDLTVEDGEIFGFLGPNGAGKSTTIDILLDFVRPTAGAASVFGHDTVTDPELIRSRTGVLPDDAAVLDNITGREHIEYRIDAHDVADDSQQLLERVGIVDAADRAASDYSRGMQQRLLLGMALVGDPDLLILDEPMAGLDPNGAREFKTIVRAENDRGTTVFFSSHNLHHVESVCDRVGVVQDGQLAAIDSVDGLRSAVDGTTTLTVQVAKDPTRALETVDAIQQVRSCTLTDDGELRVRVEPDAHSTVLTRLQEHGHTIQSLSRDESSLEAVFAAYTAGDDR